MKKVSKQSLIDTFNQASESQKKTLTDVFGKDFFQSSFRDIETFDDACRARGTTEKEFNEKFEKFGLDPDTLNYEKLKIVAKAMNAGWTPDWTNKKQYKYFPYFNVSSGFGFSVSYYYCAFAHPCCGSRLCFETEEKSDYAGKQFKELYKEFLTIPI